METEQDLIKTELVVDGTIQAHLKETAVWGKFLGIAGFVYSLLIACIAIFAGSTLARVSGNYSSSNESLLAGGGVAIFYLCMAAIVFFMSGYLFKFSKKTLLALQAGDQVIMIEAFKNLKLYFRLAGIITCVILIFTVLGVIGILVARHLAAVNP